MTEVRRFDILELPGSVKKTDEGFFFADPVVTRTGIFSYRGPDGKVRKEFRSDTEVFAAEALASMQMIPVTDGHPQDFVKPENARALSIGTTGENARRDGSNVRVPIKITTEDGIAAIEGGRLQLSLGYRCDVTRKDGEHNGVKFTHVQSNIRCNHLALCDTARAGPGATLRLDSEDAVMVETGQDKSELRKEKNKMDGSVRLDNDISYPCAPEVEKAYGVLATKHKDAAASRDEHKAALDTLQAKHDALTEEHEKLKKVDNAAEITAGVKARSDLIAKVVPMLSEEDAKKADAMSDAELRIAGIAAQVEKFDGKDADGKEHTGDYIAARLDAAVETFEKSDAADKARGSDIVGDHSGRKDAQTLAEARADMAERQAGNAKPKDKEKK